MTNSTPLAWLTDLQRSSTVDGPGLRSTVFFKGCPLRCWWCHNPETQSDHLDLSYKADQCSSCHSCVSSCPSDAIQAKPKGIAIDRNACDTCMSCTTVCPTPALSPWGKAWDLDTLTDQLYSDIPYYQSTGGGVTFSGGEPLAQADACFELMKRCRSRGIHTCLDTTGIASHRHLERSLKWTDLYLFDLKASNPIDHLTWTGVGLKRVLGALELLTHHGAQIILRCPIIPGLHQPQLHLTELSKLLKGFPNIQKLQCLPWHNMGLGKWQRLGRQPQPQLPQDNASDAFISDIRQSLSKVDFPFPTEVLAG